MEREKGLVRIAFTAFLLLLVAASLLVTGCAKPAPVPTPTQTPTAKPTPSPSPTATVKPTPTPTPAPKPPFYEGKTITITCGHSVGGSPDKGARGYAQYLPQFIPGRPKIIVENKDVGGGAMAMHYFLETAKPDGLTLVVISSGVSPRWLVQAPGHDYDLRKTEMIIGYPTSRVFFVRSSLGVRNTKDLLALGRPVIVALTSLNQVDAISGRLIGKLLGFERKEVAGYANTAEALLAVLRGEADMSSMADSVWVPTLQPQVKAGAVVPLYQDGNLKGEQIIRVAAVLDIPTAGDVYQEIYGKPPAGEAWENLKSVLSVTISNLMLVRPDFPPEALQDLRSAVKAMMASEEFKAFALDTAGTTDATKAFIYGDDATGAWQKLLNAPPSVRAALKG